MKPTNCSPTGHFRRLFAIITTLMLLMGLMIAPTLPARAGELAQESGINEDEAYFVIGFFGSEAEFVVKLVDSELIAVAREIIAEQDALVDLPDPPDLPDNGDDPEIWTPVLIMGEIIPGPVDYNPDWSYHLDPESIGVADAAIGTCDASAEEVEERLDEVGNGFLPDGFWCPWNTYLIGEVVPYGDEPELPIEEPNIPPIDEPEEPAECIPPDDETDFVNWVPPASCFPDEPALPPECFPPDDAPLDWDPPFECFEDEWDDWFACDEVDQNADGSYPESCWQYDWDSGSISGRVTDPNGTPLPFITVEAYQRFDVDEAEHGYFPLDWAEDSEWFPVGWAETGEDGNYSMPYLTPGTYRVKFYDWSWDYQEEFYDDQPTLLESTMVTVTLDQETPNIDASLTPAQVSITGTVTNPDGIPLQYTSVDAYRQVDIRQLGPDELEWFDGFIVDDVGWIWTRWAETDEEGNYALKGLPPGTYRVMFANWEEWTYEYEFYDDQPEIDTATDIVVTETTTVTNINAVLEPPPPSISGTVTDDAGNPLEGVSVYAYGEHDEWFGDGWAETDEEGTYTIRGLPSGEYVVEFSHWFFHMEFYDDQPTFDTADKVSVGEGEVTTGINASLTPPTASITGTVSLSDGEPLPFIAVTAWQYSDDGWGDDGWGDGGWWEPVGWAETDEDGTYAIPDLASGDYRIEFGTWNMVLGYYDNAPDLESADDVTVVEGEVTGGIDATFDEVPIDPWSDWDEGFVVTDPESGETNVHIWGDVSHDLTITHTITCETGVPEEVLLRLTPFADRPLFETAMEAMGGSDIYATDIYSGTIPADEVVPGDLTILVTCSNGETHEIAAGSIELIDPSGQITDAETGTPIENARVDLYTVPGWELKTEPSDTRANTCHTRLTTGERPWSDLPSAPAGLGQLADPASGRIEPKQNPLLTDSEGRFAWNVAQGCWYVEVQADGYEPVISPVVGVPPEVTELDLALTPLQVQNQLDDGNDDNDGSQGAMTSMVYLPMIAR